MISCHQKSTRTPIWNSPSQTCWSMWPHQWPLKAGNWRLICQMEGPWLIASPQACHSLSSVITHVWHALKTSLTCAHHVTLLKVTKSCTKTSATCNAQKAPSLSTSSVSLVTVNARLVNTCQEVCAHPAMATQNNSPSSMVKTAVPRAHTVSLVMQLLMSVRSAMYLVRTVLKHPTSALHADRTT